MFFFFFNDTATTEIYTLSLHDALPISVRAVVPRRRRAAEILGDLTQVLRPLFDTHAGPVGDRCCVTLAQARDQHEVGTGGRLQEAGGARGGRPGRRPGAPCRGRVWVPRGPRRPRAGRTPRR